LACGGLVTVILVARPLVEVFDPVDPVDRFLAQGRDDYSEFSYPRRRIPALAFTLIVMGAEDLWQRGGPGASAWER